MLPELWGGVECSVVRIRETYRNSMRRSGHDTRPKDIERLASLGIRALRMPVLWELVAPRTLDVSSEGSMRDGYEDWSWPDACLEGLRACGIRPIVGLVHHGSGPRYTNLLDPGFASGLADFARAVARRYPWVTDYTPVNEPLTTARFSALYGHWYPHARSSEAYVRALVHECKGIVLAMQAIREVTPNAGLVQTEDFGFTRGTPHLAYQAAHENHRRWLSLNLLCGRVTERHPLYDTLRGWGIGEDDLRFFQKAPCAPTLLGINYYLTSERYLDENLGAYPSAFHGGNGRDAYADVEAVRTGLELLGHAGALDAAWERYKIPLALTEVHLGCTREEQLRFWKEAWLAACHARERGVDVRAVTAWALFGSHDWTSLLVEERGDYEPGAFDVRSTPPRPTALARAVSAAASGRTYEHPALDGAGWWRRPLRVLYGTAPPEARPSTRQRPLLLLGGSGTLGRAFARLCDLRNLAFQAPRRSEIDVAAPGALARAIDRLQPWAVINAAGFVRVDEAEDDPASCYRVNAHGAQAVAEACAARGLPIVSFSTDLVFDGARNEPYLEESATGPLNIYGASKLASESLVRAAHPEALIVRTSAFFGPWDEANFAHCAVRTLSGGAEMRAASDIVVSPTYVPDLANAVLDLLIDGERGIWHLSNAEPVSWFAFAERACEAKGVQRSKLVPCPASELGFRARRPRYSALGSARGRILRSLDAAIADWARDGL